MSAPKQRYQYYQTPDGEVYVRPGGGVYYHVPILEGGFEGFWEPVDAIPPDAVPYRTVDEDDVGKQPLVPQLGSVFVVDEDEYAARAVKRVAAELLSTLKAVLADAENGMGWELSQVFGQEAARIEARQNDLRQRINKVIVDATTVLGA